MKTILTTLLVFAISFFARSQVTDVGFYWLSYSNIDPNKVNVFGDRAFLISTNQNKIAILDISNKSAPAWRGLMYQKLGGGPLSYPSDVFVSGNYAYVVSGDGSTLDVFDISNLAPQAVASVSDGQGGGAVLTGASHIMVINGLAYILGSTGLEIMDISNPLDPRHVSFTGGLGSTESYWGRRLFDIEGNYAYVVMNVSSVPTLKKVDISTSPPTIVNTLSLNIAHFPSTIEVSGNRAYLAVPGVFDGSLEVLDVSPLTNPQQLSSIQRPYMTSCAAVGKFAFTASLNWYQLTLTDGTTSPPTVPYMFDRTTPKGVDYIGPYFYYLANTTPGASLVFRIGTVAPAVIITSPNQGQVGGTIDLTATTGGSTGALTFSVTNVTGSATRSGNTLTLTGEGTITVTASVASDVNFIDKTVTQTIYITRVNQTINFPSQTTKTYGDAPFSPASASSGLPISYTSTNQNVVPNGSNITIVGAGTTQITASQDGDATFNTASPVTQSLTVNKAMLTATAVNKSKPYGSTTFPTYTIAYSGFVNGETSTVIEATPSFITNAAPCSSNLSPNPYYIRPGGLSDANYDFTYVDGVMTIARVDLTVTTANVTRVYNTQNPQFPPTYTGFLCGDTESVLDIPPSLTSAGSTSNVGSYPITSSGGSDNNYNLLPNPQSGNLTITPASQTLTWTSVPAICGTNEVNLLSYVTSSAGLTPSFSSSSPSIAIILNGTNLKYLTQGYVIITATQPGNTNILAANTITFGVNGSASPQGTISQSGTCPVTLTAGAGSGYIWPPPYETNTTSQIQISTPGTATYTVSYLTYGCSVTVSATVTTNCGGGGGGGGGGHGGIRRTAETESDLETGPFDQNYNLGVYPNPAQDQVRIVLTEVAKADCPVYFYDILGRTSKSIVIEKGQKSKSISIVDLQAGIYVVTISDNGRLRQRKLIVQRN